MASGRFIGADGFRGVRVAARKPRAELAQSHHSIHRAKRSGQLARHRRAHHGGGARKNPRSACGRAESSGRGGTIAAAATAKADPDGYTVLQANANLSFSHTLYKNLSYDLEKDFVPVGRFASAFYIILAHPKVGVKTLKELIAKAKAEPGKLNYASGGIGAGCGVESHGSPVISPKKNQASRWRG